MVVVRKIKDHIKEYNNIIPLGIHSKQDIHICQNDIYGLYDTEAEAYSAIIMGYRVITTSYRNPIIGPVEVINGKHFIVKNFNISLAYPPTYMMLCMLLNEFLEIK